MSLLIERAVDCPGCGRRALHRVARSVNAGRSPELAQEIRTDQFQRFACPDCNFPYLVEDPLVYIDFARKLWMGHFPRAWEGQWRRHEGHVRDGFRHALWDHAPKLARDLGAGFRVRAVFGLAALRDKILCLDAGLDDRTLEALKLDLLRGSRKSPLGGRLTLLRVDEAELVLQAAAPAQGALLHVRRARLDRLASGRGWKGALRELGAGPYVDLRRLGPIAP